MLPGLKSFERVDAEERECDEARGSNSDRLLRLVSLPVPNTNERCYLQEQHISNWLAISDAIFLRLSRLQV